MTTFLELDGSEGEGGGQILRTALSLSMCTGTPIRIANIRARRKVPGLMRQHLTAVQAAAEICGAELEGGRLGSTRLSFVPGPIRGGDYRFAIGTAGSCTLVFQTVLPALLRADEPSRIRLQGGTHNPLAPPYHFLERAFLPLLRRMGAVVSLELQRFGFYPAGGGEFTASITPATLAPLTLDQPGTRLNAYAESFCAALPIAVARRELDVVRKRLGWDEPQLLLRGLSNDQGPGNALLITLEQEAVTELFTGFGEKGVTAEAVAAHAVDQVRQYLASGAAVGPYLADQLLLPLALAGTGSFTASAVTRHSLTNAEVIRRFLGTPIRTETLDSGACRISVG
ncbi:MAG: RNA 3'-terminal phosphate cyclase [Methylococcaceae bacterium]|nr:RNA 3'-terminal phosphate cyclase [Methylococcaceae bacterium]